MKFLDFLPTIPDRRNKQRLLEFCVSRMRNPLICYFVFKNQSHYSGVRGQRVKSSWHVNDSCIRVTNC